jgi:hypothetical protein
MDDIVPLKHLRHDLGAVAGKLRSRYTRRFRRAGADLLVHAGRAGFGKVGEPPVAVFQMMIEMEVDGYHRVAYLHVAEKTSRLGWRRIESVAAAHRWATATLEEWIGELERS